MNLPTTAGARGAILASLRRAAPPQAQPVPHLQAYLDSPWGRGACEGAADRALLIAPFEAAARGWRAEVLHATPANWPQAVRAALDQHGARRVVFGADSPISRRLQAESAPLGALDGLQARPYDQPLAEWKAELFDAVDAGITSVAAGVADTGSLLLRTGPGEPRTLSLVPPLHVAVLQASTLAASLPLAFSQSGLLGATAGSEASARPPLATDRVLGRQGDLEADLPSNLLLVTGPSKTADIQQVLAYGAHGPKALVIVIVNDLIPGAAE